jgi:hypothetical protein
MCVCMYVCMYVYVCVYVCMYVCRYKYEKKSRWADGGVVPVAKMGMVVAST